MNWKKVTRGLSVCLMGVLFITLISELVLAENPIFDPVKSMFADWGQGDLSVNIAKYLFLALLTILIYSIAKVLPFLKNLGSWIAALFSLIVAFLATAYITPSEVYMMLVSYGAMGMILGAIIPLIILIFFSIEMGKEGTGGTIIQYVLWVGFIIFLGYKIYSGVAVTKTLGWVEMGVYIGIIIVSLIFVLANRQIRMALFKGSVKDVKDKGLQEVAQEDALKKIDEARFKALKRRSQI